MADATLASDSRYYFVVTLQFMSQNRTFNPHYAYRYRNEKAISLVVSNSENNNIVGYRLQKHGYQLFAHLFLQKVDTHIKKRASHNVPLPLSSNWVFSHLYESY